MTWSQQRAWNPVAWQKKIGWPSPGHSQSAMSTPLTETLVSVGIPLSIAVSSASAGGDGRRWGAAEAHALSDFDRGEFLSREESRADMRKRKSSWLNDGKR